MTNPPTSYTTSWDTTRFQSFRPSAIVTGSAYLLLHLSALECLNSFADCLTYYAVC